MWNKANSTAYIEPEPQLIEINVISLQSRQYSSGKLSHPFKTKVAIEMFITTDKLTAVILWH